MGVKRKLRLRDCACRRVLLILAEPEDAMSLQKQAGVQLRTGGLGPHVGADVHVEVKPEHPRFPGYPLHAGLLYPSSVDRLNPVCVPKELVWSALALL